MNASDSPSGRVLTRNGDRSRELQDVLTSLRAGSGVLLVGERGSGRGGFVRTVLAALDTATRARIWVGHDLELLEEAEAARFARSVLDGTIVPLATMSVRRRPGAAVSALIRDGHLRLIELGPLSFSALVRVAEEVLDGPLAADAAAAFVPARGGADTTALEEALAHARASGVLRRSEAGWTLTGPPPPNERLRTLLHSRAEQDGLDGDSATTALDVVALAPGISLAAAIRTSRRLDPGVEPAGELERLEESGVLEILQTAGDVRLRVRDGVTELLLPQSLGVLRRRRIAAAIVDELGETPALELGAGELVAFANLALILGRPVQTDMLVMAATTSLRAPDTIMSLRLAETAVAEGGGFEAEMALAAAEAQAGRTTTARERLHRLVAEAQGDAQLAGALTALSNHVLVSSVDHDALRQLEASTVEVLREPRAISTVLKGFVLFGLGDSIGAADLVEPEIDDLRGEEYAEACFVLANAAFLTGRLERADSMLDESERMLIRAGSDASKVQVMRANLRFFQGRGAESLVTLTAFHGAAAAAGMRIGQAVCGWAIGTALLAQGRVAEAARELRTSVEVMDQVGLTGMARGARSDLATALAIEGENASAVRELASSAAAPPVHGAAGKILQAQGWIDSSAGRLDDASAAFVRSAGAYAAQGLNLARLSALVDAGRAGAATTVLEQLEALSEVVEGPYAAIGLRLVRALARADARVSDADPHGLAAEFDRIGEEAASIHTHMIAAEAFSRASGWHTLAGAPRESAASARRRDEQTALCGVDRLPFVRSDRVTPLSDRETEIARLASDGLSNREIAERLTLSVRTVETHLQRVYQKLGVRGRSGLSVAGPAGRMG